MFRTADKPLQSNAVSDGSGRLADDELRREFDPGRDELLTVDAPQQPTHGDPPHVRERLPNRRQRRG